MPPKRIKKDKIYIYDTTLRDGGQTSFVNFTLQNKIDLAYRLDDLAIDYIEAGWPGANPTDTEFFVNLPKLKNSSITSFCMTSKYGVDVKKDQNLLHIIKSKNKIVTIVGKSWDFHVKDALKISLPQNIEIIQKSIKSIIKAGKEVFFDAEHFFDGYKNNPKYSLEVIKSALDAGAKWVILCDTNGGTLPLEIKNIIDQVTKEVPGNKLGIHCHNDTGNAVANSLIAVESGIRQIQGTINGLGERCGNANLVSIIPTLKFKMGYEISISDDAIRQLPRLSNYLYDMLNCPNDPYAPYIGKAAFSHKGGLHASAILKNTSTYEHINPELVGNNRNILISNQSGKSSMLARLKELKIDVTGDQIDKLLKLVKKKESEGYSYDFANASFALLAYNLFYDIKDLYKLESYKVISGKRVNARGNWVTYSTAILKLVINGKEEIDVAEGNGPVSALDKAYRKLLVRFFPILQTCKLSDYKVRILNSEAAASALIRVVIETTDNEGNRWVSVGVATDLIDASYIALTDAINYILIFGTNEKN